MQDIAAGKKKKVRAGPSTGKVTWSAPSPFVCLLCERQFQVRITRSDGEVEIKPGSTAANPIDLTDRGSGVNGLEGKAPGPIWSPPAGTLPLEQLWEESQETLPLSSSSTSEDSESCVEGYCL